MADPRILPALADLTQDIAGPVPVQLLQDWATGEQDLAAAQSLLDPFRIEGAVVASDTAGLSKLTQAADLVEVISMISRPKEIVYALGVEIGGRPIGIWIADNTEMFYPPSVSIENVVEAMWEAQRRIAARNSVRIGMCIHSGSFYEIGGGLYGPDADAVERLAEEYSRGDEILVTTQIRAQARAGKFSFEAREDLNEIFAPGVHSVLQGQGRADLRGDRRDYPHPYTDEFIRMLDAIDDAGRKQDAIRDIYARFLRGAAIVFIARGRTETEKTLATMLDDLVANALFEKVLRDANPGSALIECGGGLAVLSFTDVDQALDFAMDHRSRCERNGLNVRIGVDYGAILFFEREDGRRNLVGDPVNAASKISEDAGRPGHVSVTDRAIELLPRPISSGERFITTISNVSIGGYFL